MNGAGGQSTTSGGHSVTSLAEPPTNPTAGDLEAAAGEIDGFISQVAGAVEDPLSMLVGTGVDFVLNYVQPVRDAIHVVTGDGPALEKAAAQFAELQSSCEELATELAETFDSQLGQWQGEASEAARKKIAEFVEGVRNTGMLGHNVSELLKMSAVLMEAAEEIIKGVLTDFLTWAIITWTTALATSVVTAGGSTAGAAAATSAEASVACSRAAQQVQRVLKIIEMINTVIDNVKAVIDAARFGEAWRTIKSGTGDESSGDELATAESVVSTAGDVGERVEKRVKSAAEEAGIETDPESAAESDDTGDATGEEDGKKRFNWGESIASNTREQLGNAADDLQEQAKEGGFSDVPPDQTISGQLDI